MLVFVSLLPSLTRSLLITPRHHLTPSRPVRATASAPFKSSLERIFTDAGIFSFILNKALGIDNQRSTIGS